MHDKGNILSSVLPKDFKDCSKFEFLTKEIVYKNIKKFSDEWEASHDYWYGVTNSYSNACNGFDVNVIGDEYSKINQDTFKVVVYALVYDDERKELKTDYNHVIFSFMIDGNRLEYTFDKSSDAKIFVESMPTLFSNWDDMGKKECALYLVQAEVKRDLMYEYEISGTYELECDMREVAFVLAELVLDEDICTGTSLDALVGLINNELQGVTPTREELHALVNKYCSPCDDLNDIIKSVECEVSFCMDVGVHVS